MNRKLVLIFNSLILFLVIYFYYYNDSSSQMIANTKILKALISFAIYYLFISLVSNASKYFYSKAHRIPKNKKNNVHFGIENIADFLLSIGFIFLILSLFGVNPVEFVTSLTIVAAAFAILTKEYFVDFLSGIYLSFSNTFEVNDYVKIEGQKGTIIEISMQKVKILNDDDDVVIIPNSKVHYNNIINYSRRDINIMNVDFQLAVSAVKSIDKLEDDLIKSLETFSAYIDANSYSLKVVEMKMDYLELKFIYKLKQADMDIQKKIRRKTMREVLNFVTSRQ